MLLCLLFLCTFELEESIVKCLEMTWLLVGVRCGVLNATTSVSIHRLRVLLFVRAVSSYYYLAGRYDRNC